MPYGAKATAPAGALALTGFKMGGWMIAAVTLLFIGMALLQLARRAPAERP